MGGLVFGFEQLSNMQIIEKYRYVVNIICIIF